LGLMLKLQFERRGWAAVIGLFAASFGVMHCSGGGADGGTGGAASTSASAGQGGNPASTAGSGGGAGGTAPDAGPDSSADAGPDLTDRSQCKADPDKIGVTTRMVKTASNGTMTYVGYAPAGYDKTKPTPLVISLHGAGDTAANYFSIIWQGNADARGFLVLSPEGSAPLGPGFTYDTSDLDPIVNEILSDFTACYTIDPKRHIIHGFSAGGVLSYLVGLELAQIFSGISISSADLGTAEYYAGMPLLPAPWKIPVSQFHGLTDPNFPIDAARMGRDRLLAAGHQVYWHEFNGGHTTTAAFALQMYDDLAGSMAP
jgi:polyhydroxybutyrate depolymerase